MTEHVQYRCEIASVNGVITYFEHENRVIASKQANHLAKYLLSHYKHWLINATPAFASVLIEYNVLIADVYAVKDVIKHAINTIDMDGEIQNHTGQHHYIPICYAHPEALDLKHVASALNASIEEVIALHTSIEFNVGAVGFAPGFAYLQTLPKAMQLPRLATPRTKVPAGSLAIAEEYSAIYPQPSPGGWHIIGKCPTVLFHSQSSEPSLLNVGDKVTFHAITMAEFAHLDKVQS